jgi:hypothetical protein
MNRVPRGTHHRKTPYTLNPKIASEMWMSGVKTKFMLHKKIPRKTLHRAVPLLKTLCQFNVPLSQAPPKYNLLRKVVFMYNRVLLYCSCALGASTPYCYHQHEMEDGDGFAFVITLFKLCSHCANMGVSEGSICKDHLFERINAVHNKRSPS